MQVGKYLICSYVLANHRYLGDRMTLTWHSAALSPVYIIIVCTTYILCLCLRRKTECGACGYGVEPQTFSVSACGRIRNNSICTEYGIRINT